MININPEAVVITKRFFTAIDVLIQQRKIRGVNTFAKKYGINYWNLSTLRKEPGRRMLKPEYIAYLVRDFNVSPIFILLGVGAVLNDDEK